MKTENEHDKQMWQPEETATYWINRTARVLTACYEASLRPLGIGMAYLPVMIAVDECGPMLQKDLVRRFSVEQPTMAALIARMMRDGILVRHPAIADKRAFTLSLTQEGKSVLPKAQMTLSSLVEIGMEGITQEEQLQMKKWLNRVIENIEKIHVK